MSNLGQLAIAMIMYVSDYSDHFPASGSNGEGFHQEDWIYWQRSGDPIQRLLSGSQLVTYMKTGMSSNIFWCAAVQKQPNIQGYPYSYSMNANNNVADGFALQYDSSGNAYPFKMSAVKRGSEKLMMTEEANYASEQVPGAAAAGSSLGPDDGRLDLATNTLSGNIIGLRHSRKGGNCNFPDGHAALTPWQWSTNAYYSLATVP
jgi:prepilin-type processing-associated H-X9-DG protein